MDEGKWREGLDRGRYWMEGEFTWWEGLDGGRVR